MLMFSRLRCQRRLFCTNSSVFGFLLKSCRISPDKIAYRHFLGGDIKGKRREWTYRMLAGKSEDLSVALKNIGIAPQQRVILLLSDDPLMFMTGFFACVHCGVVCVPAPPPEKAHLNRSLQRLFGILKNCQPVAILTTSAVFALLRTLGSETEKAFRDLNMKFILVDDILPTDESHRDSVFQNISEGHGGHLAMLQYTSGSTGQPKGVCLTHNCIIHNQVAIQGAFATDESSDVVSWLPLFHDMGLLGAALHPIFVGATCTFMPTMAFLRKPVQWLQAISNLRAPVSGGPPFAYDYCVRKISETEMQSLDLSCWRVAFTGAEAIPASTLHAFHKKFEGVGFQSRSLLPVYGLAESTVFLTSPKAGTSAPITASLPLTEGKQAGPYVSVGNSHGFNDVRLVDPKTCLQCAENTVGEIWARGRSLADGYWNHDIDDFWSGHLNDVSMEPFFRTGDLGFIRHGELFICGRLKDIIIIAGRNHYPPDIEQTVEKCHDLVRPGCVAAFAVAGGESADDGKNGVTDRLIVVAEVEMAKIPVGKSTNDPLRSVIDAICAAIATAHGIRPHDVVCVKAGAVEKTTSGKVSRTANRHKYITAEFCAEGSLLTR